MNIHMIIGGVMVVIGLALTSYTMHLIKQERINKWNKQHASK